VMVMYCNTLQVRDYGQRVHQLILVPGNICQDLEKR
jgi:hypothetical protein